MKLCGCKESCFENGVNWGHYEGVMCAHLSERVIDERNSPICIKDDEIVESYFTEDEYKKLFYGDRIRNESLEFILKSLSSEEIVNEIILYDFYVNECLELNVLFDIITHEHIEGRNVHADVRYQEIQLTLSVENNQLSKTLKSHGGHKVIKSYHEDVKEGCTNWESHPPFIGPNYMLSREEYLKITEMVNDEILKLTDEYFN